MADELAKKISELDNLPNGDMDGFFTIGSKDNAQGNPVSYKMNLVVLKNAIAAAATAVENANNAVSAAQAAELAFLQSIVQQTGQNTDKTMSQKAVTDALAAIGATVSEFTGKVGDILDMIPSSASQSNQLADKAFVNSSIGTSSATYISNNGDPFTSVAQLNAYTGPHDKNDYAFVVSTDAAGNTVYSRYKYDGSAWAKEYDLNNSSFTAAQWAAINSAVTAELVAKLSALPDNATLTAALAAKQDVIDDLSSIRSKANSAYQKPSGGIPKTDLASAVQTSLGKADSAIQDVSDKADKDTDAVEGNVAQFDANGNPVDGGVPVENIAQKDGYYDTMAVGVAKNLEGRTNVTGSFMERTTGGDAEVANGLAQLNELRGNSVKWNQLMLDNINTALTPTEVTVSVNDNIATFSPKALNKTYRYWLWSTLTGYYDRITVGHKVLVSATVNNVTNPSDVEGVAISALWFKASHNDETKYFKYSSTDTLPTGIYRKLDTVTNVQQNADWILQMGISFVKNGSSFSYSGTSGSISISHVNIIDLTAIFGAGNEPATVEEVEEWLAQNVGTRDYYPYDPGSVLNNKMEGIETLGFNLLDPATGKARIVGAYSDVYGNYYGITGTHGALTFTSDWGEVSTITPDSDGKFLIETPGWLSVATPGADCAVFLWWDGTKTEYEDYEHNEAPLDVTHIYGKLNGTGDLVQVWPTGMPAIGDIKDALKIVDGAVVAERKCGEVDMGTLGNQWGIINAGTTHERFQSIVQGMKSVSAITISNIMCVKYKTDTAQSIYTHAVDKIIGSLNGYIQVYDSGYSDVETFKAAMSGELLYYELASPRVYTDLVYQGSDVFADGTPVTLPLNFPVDNWSLERILPQNTSEALVACAPELVCRYSVDAVEELDTIRASAIFVEDLKANIQALLAIVNDKLGETMGGTIAIGSTPTDKVYPFNFVPTPEPTPDTTE